jgi:hypothetical protein
MLGTGLGGTNQTDLVHISVDDRGEEGRIMSQRMTHTGIRVRTWAIGVAILLIGNALPAESATLRWKFTAGETLHYKMDQKTTTTMKPAGREIKTIVTQTIDSRWVVKSVAADGSAMISMTFDRIRNKVESPLSKMEYDTSEKREPEGPAGAMLVKPLKALVGAEFKFKLSPQGEITDIQVPKSLLDAMKSTDPNSPEAQMSTEEFWKKMVNESEFSLPKEDLAVGKGWSSKGTVPLGSGLSLILDKTYTYVGPASNAEKIKLDVKATLDAPAIPNFEVKLVDSGSSGTFLFDNSKGRIVSSEVTQKMGLQVKSGTTEDTRSTEMSNVMTLVNGK